MRNFFKLVEKPNDEMFWKIVFIKSLGENKVSIKDEEYDKNPNIQAYFKNTKLTTRPVDNEGKLFLFNVL